MTRVVAGQWGGRRLVVPPAGVRPTSQRVREAVANRLEHITGGLAGLRVLDLFAGSGSMGLELLSRGAAAAIFVERDRGALRALRRNVAALHATGATVIARDTAALDRIPPPGPCDIVFADPPYGNPVQDTAALLAEVVAGGWTSPEALVVVEAAARSGGTPWPPQIAHLDHRGYGDTRIWYGRVSGTAQYGMGP